jgi:hypothetical protein
MGRCEWCDELLELGSGASLRLGCHVMHAHPCMDPWISITQWKDSDMKDSDTLVRDIAPVYLVVRYATVCSSIWCCKVTVSRV